MNSSLLKQQTHHLRKQVVINNANTQQSSSIETSTGEAENVVSSGSIDSAVCHWESGDLVGWLKRICFTTFIALLVNLA